MDKNYVIITGGNRGIGAAIVQKAVESGYTPIVLSKTSEESAAGNILSYKVNLASSDEIINFYKKLDDQGITATSLVNNAGILFSKPLNDLSLEEMDFEWQVNLRAPLLMIKEFAQRLIYRKDDKKLSGQIVNISSISAFNVSSDVLYGATKAGVSSIGRTLAGQYSPYIRINSVAPGFVSATDMGKMVAPDRAKAYLEKSLTKIPIDPSAVADMTMYLLSDKARNITGATYEISNGVYLR